MFTHGQLHQADTVNFFISYTGSDIEWAKWIAWELERAWPYLPLAGGAFSTWY
jgi:hypothetical protein